MFDKSNACDRYIEHNNVRLALKKGGDKKFAANFLFYLLYELYIFTLDESSWKMKEVRV